LLSLVQPAPAATLTHRFALHSTGWVLVPKGQQLSWGSGAVVDQERRWFITNYHVVGDYTQTKVYFPRRQGDWIVTAKSEYLKAQPVPGTVLFVSPKRDLALIQLNYLPSGVRPLRLARASALPGDTVHMVGNSGAKTGTLWTCRSGKVKNRGFHAFTLKDTQIHLEAFQLTTDNDTAPGDSGGPVVNDLGELVGVHSNFNSVAGSKSIDVAEVKEFLHRIQNPKWKDALSSRVEGNWTMRWQTKGKDYYCSLTFHSDGTLTWDTGARSWPGTYRYQDEILTLTVPGLSVRDQLALTWDNNQDQFQFISGNITFTARRR
jgi:S1-C subfamily serine protease